MNDPERPRQTGDERLSSEMPDSTGPPRPVPKGDPVLNLITTVGVSTVAIGGVMFAMSALTSPCRGATRSAKLQWEQRQLQVEQAYQQELAYQQEMIAKEGDKATADGNDDGK